MARKSNLDESTLTKMQIRKLNTLRKSIGDSLGTKTFVDWLSSQASKSRQEPVDKTAEAVADAVMALISKGTIKSLPRGGYVVKRGRGRVVVTPAE